MFLKAALGVAMLADITALAVLNGFTFWPVAIASMVVVLMFLLSKVVKTSSSGLFAPIAVFFILVILLVLGNLGNYFNLSGINLPTEISLSRMASWDIAKASIKSNPIFGTGPSTFYYSFSKFKSQDLNYSPVWNIRFDSPSGIFFELLSTVGSLGALAAVVLVLVALSVSFMAIIKTEREEFRPIMLGLCASFISITIFSLLFAFPGGLLLIAVMIATLAVAAGVELYPEKFKALNLSFRASPNYALALAAIFLSVSAGVVILFIMGIKMLTADIYVRQALATNDINQKVSQMGKAIILAPYQDQYYLEQAKNYMSLANQEASGNKDQNTIVNYLNLAIDSGKTAAFELNPNSANDIESLALIYENASFYTKGALDLAQDLYKKEMDLEPGNPVPYLRTALIYMAKANLEQTDADKKTDIESAVKMYDEALSRKSDFSSAYYGKAIAYEALGKIDDAITELSKATLSTSDNLDYRFELGRLLFNRGVTQPNLNQTASASITNGQTEGNKLSVAPTQPTGAIVKRNNDLNNAEQIFQGIINAVSNNANAHYSLALLYQKLGENDKAKIEVTTLLNILQDQSQKDMVMKQFTGLY